MHVLVISNLYPPEWRGGYELSCHQVVEGLRRKAHRVTVLTSVPPFALDFEHPDVHRSLILTDVYRPDGILPSQRPTGLHEAGVSLYFNIYQTYRSLRALEPDIVYLFNVMGLGVMGLIDALETAGVPWVWHLGDAIPAEACRDVSAAVRGIFLSGHRMEFAGGTVIVVSERLRREIAAAGVRLGLEIEHIPYWGLTGAPPPRRERPPGDLVRFLHASAMGATKGTHLVIDATSLLTQRGHRGFAVDLCGPGDTRALAEHARVLGIEDRLRFMGSAPQADLFALYGEYDGFLFPTWHREPFGLVPVEAAACGCPPILSFGCGAAEWFVHKVHCLKVRRDASDLADAMEIFITDPEFRLALGRRAVSVANTSLNFEHILGRIEAVLERKRRPVDWAAVDWASLHDLAYVKDRLAMHFFVDGF